MIYQERKGLTVTNVILKLKFQPVFDGCSFPFFHEFLVGELNHVENILRLDFVPLGDRLVA